MRLTIGQACRLVPPSFVLVTAFALLAAGCGPGRSFTGPTVNAFTGRLTHDGKLVSFGEGEKVTVTLFHETGQSFGLPIQPDGSFKVGWMPVGRYSATLNRPSNKVGPPSRYTIPGGLTIVDGKTDYEIELGKDWKP